MYELKNLSSSNGKDTGLVRASLNLESKVTVMKTKQEFTPYIWSSNCFFKGSTDKDLEKLVLQSLEYLMQDFAETYNRANSKKPIFRIVSP